jgi:hypothetical protein
MSVTSMAVARRKLLTLPRLLPPGDGGFVASDCAHGAHGTTGAATISMEFERTDPANQSATSGGIGT